MNFGDVIALMRLSIRDPIEGGRHIIALNPPMSVRWMLLAASVLVSVVLVYAPALAVGGTDGLPTPFAFVATQALMNLLVIGLITIIGRNFGGTGGFADVLWLLGWMQAMTTLLLVAQIVAILVLPSLHVPVAAASIALSIWVLVGYICAVHGFTSRIAVLIGGVMTFIVLSFVLSMILLFLGFAPPEIQNV